MISYHNTRELHIKEFHLGCSNTYLKSFETLKTQYDNLRIEFNKSEFDLATYKRGLASVEEQLVFYNKNEVNKSVSENSSNEIKKSPYAPIIEEWVFDCDEDESEVMVNSVNTAKRNRLTSTVGKQGIDVVKSSACWVWIPKIKALDHGDPQVALKDTGIFDSGCSRHMTGNKSYLIDYQDYDGGFIAFAGSSKGGKIPGKGKIRTGKLDFEDVYFVKELKFNLFSVSQMCDRKNSVLFTKTECLILSPDFKLPDESQVMLKIPRKDNMYSFDLKIVVPSKGLTCLFANATNDECLPSKIFENDHTCVACQKGKQHKATYSLLPIPFWAKADITACYERIRPFGCPVTILNTLDHLGKFDGKADEGFLVGYSINSKAFRVFNSRTRKVEENLHVNFIENKPNVVGIGPKWLFDIDSLTNSMNYQPVSAGNRTNGYAVHMFLQVLRKLCPHLKMMLERRIDSPVNAASSSFTTVEPGRERGQRNEFESLFGQDKDASNVYRVFTPVNATTSSNTNYPTDLLMLDLEDTANL
ncbi:ribonuclease H-like domain-containing protein [Tanacetum coccineum]